MKGKPRGFSQVEVEFSNYYWEFRLPLVLAQGGPSSIRVARDVGSISVSGWLAVTILPVTLALCLLDPALSLPH